MKNKTKNSSIMDFSKEIIKVHLNKLKIHNKQEYLESTHDISQIICDYIKKQKRDEKFIVTASLFNEDDQKISMDGICIWNPFKDQLLQIKERSEGLIIIVTVWVITTE